MAQRGKKAVLNTGAALLQEAVAVVCGFILPGLILRSFGSVYNGLTSSITQFLSCAVLLRAGIGGATRAALYKPLADNDKTAINGIMNATRAFMKKIALILAIVIIVFSCIYPIVVKEFDWFFTFSLFIIIGISTFAESLFGITNLILLQADQRLYVASLMRSFVYILGTVVSSVLIITGAGIHMVKLGGALAFCVYPLFLNFYVKKKYKLDANVPPNNNAISQRWDAFWHQVAVFVMNNTDTVILTIFSNMTIVSVYSVYNLVINGLRKLVLSFTSGLEGALGNLLVSDSDESVRSNFNLICYILFGLATIINVCAGLLIVPFVKLYTSGVTDAQYEQNAFAVLLISAHFFNCIRQPYQLIVQAAGHYAQTKAGAILEPVINITLSIILVIKLGLIGVVIGTLVSTVIRTIQYALYVSKVLVRGAMADLIKRLIISMVEALVIIAVSNLIPFDFSASYLLLLLSGLIILVLSLIVFVIFSLLFQRKESALFLSKINNIIFRRKPINYES